MIVGKVESVNFTPDLARVVIGARIDSDVADTLSQDALFWVVRPEVSSRGISGLSTVLSGVYIDSAWTPATDGTATDFAGLGATPLIRPGREGTRVTINAKDGSLLVAGAPVYFRGVEVGQLDVPKISTSGAAATVDAFINAPMDKFLTTASRFWEISGFSVKLGPTGLELSVGTLDAILTGGVSFDTVVSGGGPVGDAQQTYELYADEASARESVFSAASKNAVTMSVVFSESVSGLAVGAPVEYRGLRVGQVTAIGAFLEQAPTRKVVRLRATIVVDPQSFGLPADADKAATVDFVAHLVDDGLRAKLATTSIFSSGLKIALSDEANPAPASLREDADGVPVIPSVVSELPDFTATAEGVLKRINNLPIEAVMEQAVSLMASIQTLTSSKGTQAVPQAILDLVDGATSLVTRDSTKAIPDEVLGAISDLRTVVADLRSQGAVAKLGAALGSAQDAAANIATASQDVPKLVSDLRSVAAKANSLRTAELVDAATRVLDNADALISSEGARAVPPALASALDEVRAAVQELRQGGAIENTNATLASARDAAQAVAKAARNFPDISGELNGVVAQVKALIGAYGDRSAFNTEARGLIRQLTKAADSVTQLTREIARKPNSLLLGR